jgi:transcriptional regulator with XRE-family HTH domain
VALFFDVAWFDAKLAGAGLSRAVVAQALGLSGEQLAEVWKDQRELSAQNVSILALLLGAPAEEIARQAGISTPVPKAESGLREIEQRLARVEKELAELKALVAGRA